MMVTKVDESIINPGFDPGNLLWKNAIRIIVTVGKKNMHTKI